MSEGVLVTVTWTVRPELADSCVALLGDMFQTTRLRKGFRNIRLLRSEADATQLIMLQEWDSVAAHQSYMQFRTEAGDIAKLMAMMVAPPKIGYWSPKSLAETQA